MATILKNILSFTGLVVGVPVALPHRLNVNGIPVLPRTVEPNIGGFTITANTLNVTVTRTADAASGNVDVLIEFWHTIEAVVPLVPPPGKLIGQVPWIQQPGTGGGGGGGTNFVYTYQPDGGQAGPFVFDDFTALYGALNAARLSAQGSAGFTLVFDNTSNPTMLVPAGVYDMEGVAWISVQWGRGRTTDHLVTFADGVSITGMSTVTGLRLSPDPAATTPPITLGIGPLQLIESTIAGGDNTQCCVCGVPGFSAEIVVDQYSTIGGDTVEAAVLIPAGDVLQVMLGGASALIDIFAFDDDGGTGTINVYVAEESSTYTQSQVHLTNTPGIRQECPFWHWSGDPNGVVDASADLDTRWLLVDDLTGTRWRNVTGGIWVLDSSGGGGTPASDVLTFRPGSGLTGPVVFDDFNDLYAQFDSLRSAAQNSGKFKIVFDDQDVGGLGNTVVLDSGPGNITYDFQYATLIGVHEDANVLVDIQDGGGETDSLTIINALWFEGLTIRATGQDTAFDTSDNQTFTLTRTTFLGGGGEYVMDFLGVSGCILHLNDESAIYRADGAGNPTVFPAGVAAIRINTTLVTVHMNGANCRVNGNAFISGGGGQLTPIINSSSARFNFDQADVGGVVSAEMSTAAGYWTAGPAFPVTDPNGVLTATTGTMIVDEATGIVWVNADGGTVWVTLDGGVERLAADGAASPFISTTYVSGAGTDLTLANGVRDGFVKEFVITGGTGSITPANLADGNTLSWTVTPANVSFIWDAVGVTWHVSGNPYNMVTT